MKLRWLLYTWPGLAQVVGRAEVSGLLLAMLFALGLNFLLAATFVWQELLSPWLRGVFWSVLCVCWLVCVVMNIRRDQYFRSLLESDVARDLFLAANKEYLRGRFKQARENLDQLIELNPRDAEARLLLTTIGLREGRINDCDRQLRQMQRLSSAANWSAEIRQQWKRLEQIRQELNTGSQIDPS